MRNDIQLSDQYGRRPQQYRGELEFEIRDKRGRTIQRIREPNIIKIFAKEILSHRLPYSKVWDPTASSGAGAWVAHSIDIDEFAAKYIVFGASFDVDGNPLDTADTRFYTLDAATGGYIPITLGAGAEYDGGLINAVPITEPGRPLKRVERVYFEPTYQPSGTPLLEADVRAMNSVVVLESTLLKAEYNGFGTSSGDYFTITEVALVGAAETGAVGACECAPRDLFLTGESGLPLAATASGTATITLDSGVADPNHIKEGDQVKIVSQDTTAAEDSILEQLNPYYLVVNKAVGGHDITLDRTPVTSASVALTGNIGVFRDGFRIFSHRILASPVKKSVDFEIVVRWRIIMN
jgi:hypothetical protein